MQGSYSATYSTGCDKPVCTRATLWRQHYITTSKEYLTNNHILSIYFELAFLQLHLVKISCKLIIIWMNYERNKKGARFFETQRITIQSERVVLVLHAWLPFTWSQVTDSHLTQSWTALTRIINSIAWDSRHVTLSSCHPHREFKISKRNTEIISRRKHTWPVTRYSLHKLVWKIYISS